MFKRFSIYAYALSFALVAAVGLVGCESAPSSPLQQRNLEQITIIKSPNDDRQYSAMMLPNGLQVVLVSDPSLENSAASLAVGVGSAHDPVEQQGLAHYLEHMLFLGTEKYPEPDGFMKYTQANGGMTNAFTAFDKTNYLFQINASKFDEALDRFSDYFKKPTFDPHFSDKERNAVNNEWSMQKAQDGWNTFRLEGLIANPKNPRTKFSIGNLETLKDKEGSMLHAEMLAFYKRYYSANIMRLTLVGKQSLPELKALAEKHFAVIPNHNVKVPEITEPGLTKDQYAKTIHYKPIAEFKELFIDFPIKSTKSAWRLKQGEYVHNLITSEEMGTLGEQLRRKGLVQMVSAELASDAYGPDGYLRVNASLTDLGLQKEDEIIAAIFNYVELIQREGIKENYFRELQVMRSKDFEHASKPDPVNQAVGLSMAQFDLPVENLLNSEFVYERFDAKALKQFVAQLDKRKARIWYVNKDEVVDTAIPHFEGSYRVGDITAEDYAHWDSLAKNYQFNLPPLNNLFTDKPAPIVDALYKKPHQVLSQPGVEAFLVHPEFYREDKGMLSLQINSPLGNVSAKNMVLASLLSNIYAKQQLALIDRAGRASLKIDITPSTASSQAVFISGYTTKHAQLLEELLNAYVNLTVDDKVYSEVVDSYRKGLENSEKNHVFRQLYGHINRLTKKTNWDNKQLLAELAKITQQDVIHYHSAVKKDALIRILAAGNYTEASVKDMALQAAKILPGARMPEQRTLPLYITPKQKQVVELKESLDLADSAVLQAWFRDAKSDDERAQLTVLNALFGNAFFMQLRTHEQLGYVVQSFDYAVDDVPGFVMLVQSSNSDLPKIKARMDKFRKEYLAVLQAIDPAEIEQAKQAELANVLQKPTDFYQEMNLHNNEFFHGQYTFDGRDRYIAALQKVTKEDVVKLYQTLLLNDKAGAILLQIRGTNFKDAPFAKVK